MCLYVCLRKSLSYEDPTPPTKQWARRIQSKVCTHLSPQSLTGYQEYRKCSVSAQWRNDYIQEVQRCRLGKIFRTSPYTAVLFSSRRLRNSLLEGQFHSVTSNCQRLFYITIHTVKQKKNHMHLFRGGGNMSFQRNWTTSQLHTSKHITQILRISNLEEHLHRSIWEQS